ELYTDPRHPYTLGLLKSVPRLDEVRKERLDPIPGMPPDMVHTLPGCPFYPRCTFRQPRNKEEMPPLRSVVAGHDVACWVDVKTAPQHEITDETAVKVGGEHQLIDDELEDETAIGAGTIGTPAGTTTERS